MTNCLGVVLAGGQSSRMGTDKAHLDRVGQSMLEYTASLLRELGLPVRFSGQVQQGGTADIVAEAGPLGGIFSVLNEQEQLVHNAMLIVPVDMPLMGAEALQRLLDVGREQGKAVCYTGCYLPLYLPITDELTQYLENIFSGGELPDDKKALSIYRLLLNGPYIELDIEQPELLVNTNTPEQWRSALAKISHG